jgi:hypothetical protein
LAEGAFGDAEFGEDAEVVVEFLGGNAAVEEGVAAADVGAEAVHLADAITEVDDVGFAGACSKKSLL